MNAGDKMNKIDKFYEIKNLMKCPRCGKKIRFHGGGLVCKWEHRFDISSKGYVNMLQENRALKGYDKAFFQSRRRIFEAGYYAHLVEAVTETAARYVKDLDSVTVVDAGCGEGFYSLAVQRYLEESAAAGQVLAFDIAADAIKTAAKSEEPVKWMVADITNIPVKDGAADVVLDVFTPANYGEFSRILAENGVVIKVIPGANHMRQLREAAADQLRNKDYSNEEVLDYFLEHFHLAERFSVSRTLPVSGENLEDLVRMTPLLFDVDKHALDLSAVSAITVEGEILVGKK